MEIPDDRQYTSEDEWVRIDGDEATVGITDFAQDQLGDIVYLELPDVGRALTRGDPFGVIESVKAVSDLFVPLSGEVTARNDALIESPELINASPYEDGWMFRLRIADRDEIEHLLGADEYRDRLPDE